MGKIQDNKFKRRFGEHIYAVYPNNPLPPAKQKEAASQLRAAFIAVANELLGRAVKTEELLGIVRLKIRK